MAFSLLDEVEKRNLLKPGRREKEISTEIATMARELFGIERHWHGKLTRVGASTLLNAYEPMTDRAIEKDDIVFLDLGPILEKWKGDVGRTYVIGDDPKKHKLRHDINDAFVQAKERYNANPDMTGAELFNHVRALASDYGWAHTAPIAGHLIGCHPDSYYARERRQPESKVLISSENNIPLNILRDDGEPSFWILEIHFVDEAREIGGFVEDLLNLDGTAAHSL